MVKGFESLTCRVVMLGLESFCILGLGDIDDRVWDGDRVAFRGAVVDPREKIRAFAV